MAKLALGATDLVTVSLSGGLALLAETSGHRSAGWLVLAAPVVWIVALIRQRLYTARCISRRLEEFRRIVAATVTWVAAMALVSFAADASLTREWLGVAAVAGAIALSLERELARSVFLKLRRAGRLRRPVVVVGANQEALELIRMMERDPSIGYDAVGVVTDDYVPEDDPAAGLVLGSTDETASIVERTGAIGVVIATTAVTTSASNRLARSLTDQGIHVELSSSLRDVNLERLRVSAIGPFPTVYVEAVRRGGWRAVAKRAFDIGVAGTLLLLLAPVLVVTSLAVELTSRGGILFRQQRVGKDGRLFNVLKFRTMVADAERQRQALAALNEADGPLFKITNDPRVTRVGRLLRRSSIDELPQLWNVLRGEMSLVGPRPALPEEAEHWTPAIRERVRVKPGITGMWQVHGRSTASFDQYVRLDLYYVDNWTLFTDLAIVARTVPIVLSRRGAV